MSSFRKQNSQARMSRHRDLRSSSIAASASMPDLGALNRVQTKPKNQFHDRSGFSTPTITEPTDSYEYDESGFNDIKQARSPPFHPRALPSESQFLITIKEKNDVNLIREFLASAIIQSRRSSSGGSNDDDNGEEEEVSNGSSSHENKVENSKKNNQNDDEINSTENILQKFLNYTDENGNTPLHYAVMNSADEMIMLLMEFGSSDSIKNNEGKTPLDIASPRIRGFMEAVTQVKELLQSVVQKQKSN